MEDIKSHLQNICKSGDPTAEKVLLGIVRDRNHTRLTLGLFFDLLSEIWELLKCKNCETTSNLLILLQSICTEATVETADILLGIRETDVKYFSNHAPEEDCKRCEIILSTTSYLTRLVDLWLSCPCCKKVPKSYIQLPCLHLLCKSCWIKTKHDAKKSYPKAREILCPVDQKPTSADWFCNLKESQFIGMKTRKMDAKQAPTRSKNSNSENYELNPEYLEIPCPKCQRLCNSRNGEFLTTCEQCDYYFCSNCQQNFHGFTECQPIATTSLPAVPKDDHQNAKTEGASISKREMPAAFSTSSGPIAMEFENDFYSNLQTFTSEDVHAAFGAECFEENANQVKEWPWEIDTKCSLWSCIPEYRSLQVGNWVEDDILEKCVHLLLQQNNAQDSFVFLESYVMKYAAIKNGDDAVLQRILLEKKILEKKVALVLINTDFGGHGGHWILGVVLLDKKKIILMDSSLVLSPAYYHKSFFILLRLLDMAHALTEGEALETKDWQLIVGLDTVQQQNAYDCGPLVVCNAYATTQKVILGKQPETSGVREWLLYTLQMNDEEQKRVTKGKGQQVVPERDTVHPTKKFNKFKPKYLKVDFLFLKGMDLF